MTDNISVLNGRYADMKIKDPLCSNIAMFTAGAYAYSLVEIIWRGFTHWTMALTGGLCLTLLSGICRRTRRRPLLVCCLYGALTITAIEFIVGCIVNLLLGWKVWDYSARPLNILGQICPLFTLMWFLLCIPVMCIMRGLYRAPKGE